VTVTGSQSLECCLLFLAASLMFVIVTFVIKIEYCWAIEFFFV
jgi:hypothetical protein